MHECDNDEVCTYFAPDIPDMDGTCNLRKKEGVGFG
jgi:hypothetical protein